MKVNRKMIFMLSYLVMASLIMGGCAEKEKKEDREDNVMSWRTITAEYLLEHFDISEEDLEGVDVESFLSTYEIDIDKIEKYDIPGLLKIFVEEDAAEGIMSYQYMFEESVSTILTEENVKNITRIAWEKNEGDSLESIVFDFEKGRVYAGADIDYYCNDDLVGSTNDNMKQKVMQVISEYEIYSWKDYYQGGSTEGTTASYQWFLAFEFSDGTIYRTGGEGLGDKARPDNMEAFVAALRECESESTPVSQ